MFTYDENQAGKCKDLSWNKNAKHLFRASLLNEI